MEQIIHYIYTAYLKIVETILHYWVVCYSIIYRKNNRTNIVVSRYNKNVDFVYRINNGQNINIIIYDKENPFNPYNIPVNKGNEASAYLKHIIDFYDNLTDFTFFIHDEEFAWHHSGSIIDKYNESVLSNKKYYNINDKCIQSKRDAIKTEHGIKVYNELMEWYDKYIEEYIPLSSIPNNQDFIYGFRNSAQFLVHKDIIRNLPKKFYERLYDWIITTDMPNWKNGRFMEWTWHIFWDIHPNRTSVSTSFPPPYSSPVAETAPSESSHRETGSCIPAVYSRALSDPSPVSSSAVSST